MMSQDEHIEWCKKRALEYLDAGQLSNAFTSMLSDVRKHPECKDHPGLMIGAGFMMLPGWLENREEIRRWIVGFR